MQISLAASIVGTLSAHGVKRIFGVPGGGSSLALIDAAAEVGIEFILCRTETAAAFMAAVTGELSGVPGVVLTGIGPGAASVVNGIAYASLERAPVILITDTHEECATAPPHQIFDQQALFAPISKAQKRLYPADGAEIFEAMFDLAIADPPGPVHIDLSAKAAGTLVSKLPTGLSNLAKNIDNELLNKMVGLIASCKRPILIVGLQCRNTACAAAANQLAESLAGPVMSTYKAKGIVADDNPLYVGLFTGAKLDDRVINEADLIVFCGVDPVEIIPGQWRYNAAIAVLTESADLAWPFEAEVMVEGAIASTVTSLVKVKTYTDWKLDQIAWFRQDIRERLSNRGDNGHFPDDVIDALAQAAPAGARIAIDAGAHMFSAMTRWPASKPHDVLKSNGLSSMGFALPAALAGWLQQPERHAIAVTGDVGIMMSPGRAVNRRSAGSSINRGGAQRRGVVVN